MNSLTEHGHETVALGKEKGNVSGVTIETEKLPLKDIDTVTLYVNPSIQKEYYDYVVALQPKRIIFNPGAENSEFEKLAQANGIETMHACTLVLLSTNQY
jgi:predicted CoA-binding protein